jgi:hypothetical protein
MATDGLVNLSNAGFLFSSDHFSHVFAFVGAQEATGRKLYLVSKEASQAYSAFIQTIGKLLSGIYPNPDWHPGKYHESREKRAGSIRLGNGVLGQTPHSLQHGWAYGRDEGILGVKDGLNHEISIVLCRYLLGHPIDMSGVLVCNLSYTLVYELYNRREGPYGDALYRAHFDILKEWARRFKESSEFMSMDVETKIRCWRLVVKPTNTAFLPLTKYAIHRSLRPLRIRAEDALAEIGLTLESTSLESTSLEAGMKSLALADEA